MEMQPIRASRQSKGGRKISFNSQAKPSNAIENRTSRMLQSSRVNQSYQFQPVFNEKSTMLEPAYCDTIASISSIPIMHIGICLPIDKMANALKQLFSDSITKAFPTLNKLRYNRESTGNIYFLPFWYYSLQNCSIIVWLLPAEHFKQFQKRRIYDIFLSYPQVIFIDSQTYVHFEEKRLNLTKLLKFQQQIVLLDDRQGSIIKYSRRKQSQNHKYHFVENVDQNILKSILLLTMKKNSLRCFQQSLKINFFVLQALSYGNQFLQDKKYDLQNQNNLATVLNLAASNYLTQQVQKKYDSLTQTFKNSPPKHQKQLQIELNQYQQFYLKEVKANYKILNSKQKERQLCEASQKIISANNQQILSNNRQMAKRQNNQMIIELYEKLLNNFEKGKYNSKDRQLLMAQDLENLMQQYEKKAVKSGSLFFIFNSFMRHNKSRYYQKIQSLEDQTDCIRKTQNFDEIYDKIDIKKKVLYTLQRQVRHLENKKNQIQLENEHIKNIEKQFNQKRFQGDIQEFAQADSIKTIKTRPIPQKSPRGQNSNIISQKKPKNKQNLMKKKHKKTCFQCCNCSIF